MKKSLKYNQQNKTLLITSFILALLVVLLPQYSFGEPLRIAEITEIETASESAELQDETIATDSAQPATSFDPSSSPTASPSPLGSTVATSLISPSPVATPPTITRPTSPTNLRYNCYSGGTRVTLRWDSLENVDGYETKFAQKNSDYSQTNAITRAEVDLEIKSNTSYTWSVVSLKNNLKSEDSLSIEFKCNGSELTQTLVSPSPSPSLNTTPSTSPTKKPLAQKVASIFVKSPTPTPTTSPTIAPIITQSPTPNPGNLSDIFKSPVETPNSNHSQTTSPNIFSKIILGWQALFYRFVESLGR